MSDVTYVPGGHVAVVGPGALVLLPADVEPRLAREVHAVLVPGVGVADVLQVLTGEFATSLARIPAFALAVLSASGVQAVARGGLAVRVGSGTGAETVSGEGVATWTERFVAGADDVALLGPDTDEGGESWPLDGGIVRAAAVSCRGGAAPASPVAAQPAREAAATQAVEAAPTTARVAQPAPAVASTVEPVLATEPEPEPARESVPTPDEPAAPAPRPAAPTPDEPAEPAETAEPAEPAVPEPSPAALTPDEPAEETVVPVETLMPSAVDAEDSFDHLFGSTVLRPVELAAVRADEDDEVDLDLDHSASSPVAPPAPSPAATPAPEPAQPTAPTAQPAAPALPADQGTGGTAASGAAPASDPSSAPAWKPPFMLDVPGGATPRTPAAASGSPAPPTSTPTESPGAPTPELGDHDGETVVRQPFEVVAPAPVETPRGAVGRVRLSTGQEIDLDRPVVVGRKPRVSRVGGTAVPRLVSVPSPEQDISRSHLEVRLEGVSVLVVDLGSTNGSTLLRTGQLPVRLHPHEAVLVVDGDVVDLGEGITLTFEGLA